MSVRGATVDRVRVAGLGAALAVLLGFTGGIVAAAERPVKIGILSDMAGPISDTVGAGSVVAAELAVEDAGGTVLGRPIEIVSADHQYKPDSAGAIVRRWYDVDGVDVVADAAVSVVGLMVQGIAKERGKIALISGSGSTDLFGKACSPTASSGASTRSNWQRPSSRERRRERQKAGFSCFPTFRSGSSSRVTRRTK